MYPYDYRNQSSKLVDCNEIPNLIQQDVQLIDLRNPQDYNREHIDKFINIPLQYLSYNLDRLDRNKPIYLICSVGKQSNEASQYLNQLGYNAYSFIGGMHNYKFVANPLYY